MKKATSCFIIIKVMKMQFICPVCKEKFEKKGNSLVCVNGHCFDYAKSGYVNLLTGSKGGNHGDNRLMINARRGFLSKGYYEPLRNGIVRAVEDRAFEGAKVVDCGCGEGYYTNEIAKTANGIELCAFDISKDAVSLAARAGKSVEYAVASSFDIPLENESVDILIEVFSPFCKDEFERVLRKGGKMIMVIPLENHLFELKKAVYDEPYRNVPSPTGIDGFILENRQEIKYDIEIKSNEDIKNLFMMTPYYYKTGAKEQSRLNTLQTLSVKTEFLILSYKKCE